MKYFSIKNSLIFILMLCSMSTIVLGDCPLSTVPSTPVQNWSTNVDTVISEVKKLAGSDTKCTKPAGYPGRLDVAVPIRSVQLLTGYMQAMGYNIGTLTSDIRYYFDNAGMILPVEQSHQNSILDIQKKIVSAGIYIGSRCSQNSVFASDITLANSQYSTKGKSIQQVLGDLSKQNTEVLKYFRNLIKNVQSREYIDETNFLIAPKGFASDMQNFYTSDAIQKCHDADPKNIAIKDALKKSFSVGWKYPQAIKIWKDAFALLLYSASGSTSDATKNAQIKSIVQARKGGLGNSKFLLNSEFFKEFGRRANSQTISEQIKDVGKRLAYETFGSLFRRQTIGDVSRSTENTAYTNLLKFAETDSNANELAALDRSNYDSYAMRKIFVGQNKEQDSKTVTGLIQSLEELSKDDAALKENKDIACNDVLNKQATNISHPTCSDFMKG